MSIHDQNPRSWHSADDPRNERILLFLHEWTWGVKCVLLRPPVPGTDGMYASFVHKHGNVGDRVRGRTETECAEELLRYYARRIEAEVRRWTRPGGTVKLCGEQVMMWVLGRMPRPMVPDKPGGTPVPAPLLDPYVADFTYVTSPPVGRLAKLRGLRAILLDFAAKLGVNLAPLPGNGYPDDGETNDYPPELVAMSSRAAKIRGVETCGLTRTADGRWALLVTLREQEKDAHMRTCKRVLWWAGETRVVFAESDGEPVVARPAHEADDER